jgi:hypothetical protein
MNRFGRFLGRGVLLVALSLVAGHAQAQGAGDGFLFKPPKGSVSFRGGFDRASTGSDLFAFAADQLTLSRGDFSSLTFATDVDFQITAAVEVRFSVGVSRSTIPSEFRDWVDNDRQPILQTTGFNRVPITASLKTYLFGQGRRVGHFAWVPARYAPYVGGGGGVMWYRFKQSGDFIDFATTRVFHDYFDSSGVTPTAQAFAGTDISLSPRFAVSTEGRYQWARAPLSRDFSGFERIDLSGFALTAGFSIRY